MHIVSMLRPPLKTFASMTSLILLAGLISGGADDDVSKYLADGLTTSGMRRRNWHS